MKSNEITLSSELSKRQLQALPYLLSCPSYEEAAKATKISPKQIYEWLKNLLSKLDPAILTTSL